MPRRDPREARALGLWTAGWLFALLLAGLLWIGDLRVQWPVLLVPVLWAVVAARPRRGRGVPPPAPETWELPASRPLPRPPESHWS
ncbi:MULTISPECIES: hypothetical protein [unclassified Geodermatophilus]